MNKEREMTCIVCPNGCSLKVSFEDTIVLDVKGATCNKGVEYAKNEITNPMRNLTSSIKVTDGLLPLVSVRSDRPVPKGMLKDTIKLLREITVKAPVHMHQIILKDIMGTGINIIATKEIGSI